MRVRRRVPGHRPAHIETASPLIRSHPQPALRTPLSWGELEFLGISEHLTAASDNLIDALRLRISRPPSAEYREHPRRVMSIGEQVRGDTRLEQIVEPQEYWLKALRPSGRCIV